MNRIRAISFDLDNTLWDVWPAIVRAEQETYAFLSERYPRIAAKYSMEALRSVREQVGKDEPHMGHDFTYLRIASIQRCAQSVGYDGAVGEEAFAVFYRARNSVTLYREVLTVLTELRRHYPLYTLTNGNADLAVIGIHEYFHGSFAARDAGALKPDPAVFQRLLAHSGLDADQVLHIGDDPVADIQGARRVGMQTVWMNRTGDNWSPVHGPVPHTIASLEQLLVLLNLPVNTDRRA